MDSAGFLAALLVRLPVAVAGGQAPHPVLEVEHRGHKWAHGEHPHHGTCRDHVVGRVAELGDFGHSSPGSNSVLLDHRHGDDDENNLNPGHPPEPFCPEVAHVFSPFCRAGRRLWRYGGRLLLPA